MQLEIEYLGEYAEIRRRWASELHIGLPIHELGITIPWNTPRAQVLGMLQGAPVKHLAHGELSLGFTFLGLWKADFVFEFDYGEWEGLRGIRWSIDGNDEAEEAYMKLHALFTHYFGRKKKRGMITENWDSESWYLCNTIVQIDWHGFEQRRDEAACTSLSVYTISHRWESFHEVQARDQRISEILNSITGVRVTYMATRKENSTFYMEILNPRFLGWLADFCADENLRLCVWVDETLYKLPQGSLEKLRYVLQIAHDQTSVPLVKYLAEMFETVEVAQHGQFISDEPIVS